MRGFGTLLAALAFAAPANAATITERFTASDGVALQTTLTGADPLAPRATVVEFTPYGRSGASFNAGPSFNHLLVQIRGTGDSNGSFDGLGPRTQRDVQEVLGWACRKSWSNGSLGLNGFSASAITVYNSLHLELPCVKGAVLKSGTHELYRDLFYPGGVFNVVPGAGVMALIGAPALAQAADRDPATGAAVVAGLFGSGLEGLRRPTLDGWWRERGFRGNVNDIPVLAVNGFFDVESRGAFEGYQELRGDGAHLIVVGAHDERPAGTDGGAGKMRAWFDRYLRGVDNGVEDHPRVQMLLADGDRKAHAAGRFVRRDADDWPVPGTRWRAFALSAKRSGSARSLNDGSLVDAPPLLPVKQAYLAVTSLPTATDVPNAAIVDGGGASPLTSALPLLSDMRLAEPLGLSYTTAPLPADLDAAGPGSLEVTLSSTAVSTAIWAIVSDVGPDGVAHPLTVGRLNTDFPDVDPARSRRDAAGNVVQPYGRYDVKRPATPLVSRRYQVELWPIGNRFKRGHRIRLHLVGPSAASAPIVPALNSVTVGGPQPSRLLLPVLP